MFPIAYTAPGGNPYTPAFDGQRFVFATPPPSTPTPLVLVTNWTSDLDK
jgi:hypothetical protein